MEPYYGSSLWGDDFVLNDRDVDYGADLSIYPIVVDRIYRGIVHHLTSQL